MDEVYKYLKKKDRKNNKTISQLEDMTPSIPVSDQSNK